LKYVDFHYFMDDFKYLFYLFFDKFDC
jgi:hypothetical protein